MGPQNRFDPFLASTLRQAGQQQSDSVHERGASSPLHQAHISPRYTPSPLSYSERPNSLHRRPSQSFYQQFSTSSEAQPQIQQARFQPQQWAHPQPMQFQTRSFTNSSSPGLLESFSAETMEAAPWLKMERSPSSETRLEKLQVETQETKSGMVAEDRRIVVKEGARVGQPYLERHWYSAGLPDDGLTAAEVMEIVQIAVVTGSKGRMVWNRPGDFQKEIELLIETNIKARRVYVEEQMLLEGQLMEIWKAG